jgi:hypothetical protein
MAAAAAAERRNDCPRGDLDGDGLRLRSGERERVEGDALCPCGDGLSDARPARPSADDASRRMLSSKSAVDGRTVTPG